MKILYNEVPNQIFKKQANIEAEISCQLFSDKGEKNRLEFTTRAETPQFTPTIVKRNKVFWKNFFISNVLMFRP